MITIFARYIPELDWGDAWTEIKVSGEDEDAVAQVITAKLHQASFEVTAESGEELPEGAWDE